MTIDNASIVDSVGTDSTTGVVHLGITHHLPLDAQTVPNHHGRRITAGLKDWPHHRIAWRLL
ncbi:hypothetical protein VLK31_21225 [Variovorax sp. H27-G14]|uniref:hypothetical protein n=1 Tax=Variovorax sp. H27-G14 TaxID=3111914 RepID=UPI0038FC8FEE